MKKDFSKTIVRSWTLLVKEFDSYLRNKVVLKLRIFSVYYPHRKTAISCGILVFGTTCFVCSTLPYLRGLGDTCWDSDIHLEVKACRRFSFLEIEVGCKALKG